MKGKRRVRNVARGIIALWDFPLSMPPYGEPRVLPAAALEACLQRRLAAELEAAGQSGPMAPEIELGTTAVTITAIPTTFQKSRCVAATMFRWSLPTSPRQHGVATDGKVGLPGRSPRGLCRIVHNRE